MAREDYHRLVKYSLNTTSATVIIDKIFDDIESRKIDNSELLTNVYAQGAEAQKKYQKSKRCNNCRLEDNLNCPVYNYEDGTTPKHDENFSCSDWEIKYE